MIQLERIIDLISSLNSEGTITSISSALAELSIILDLDRCVLRNRVDGSTTFRVISEWCAEGLVPIDVLEPEMDSQASLNLVQQFLLSGEVKINDIYVAPGFTAEEVELAKEWGCRAFLFIPLRYQNAINGMIVAIQSANARNWTNDDKYCTQLVGETALAVWLHNQSLKALSDSKQHYKWALDASNDAVWDWHMITGKAEFSRRFYQMLGYDPLKVVIDADFCKKHIHPDDFVFIIQATQSVKNQQQKKIFIEFRIYSASGELLWLRCSGRLVEVDEKGLPLRMVGTYSDITTFKKTLQQLELARQNADRANLSKSEFLARMSHEVRTPLNAIMGMLHLLKDTPLSESQQEKLHIMHDSSKQLLLVLNDVLDFSKIESGKLELESIPFFIEDVVQQVFTMLAIKAEEKGLQLLLGFSLDTPAVVVGDPNRLGQILVNLLSNAIKFTEKGEVELSIVVRQKNKYRINFEFSVIDTGIGIKDEEMSVLFNSFAQAKKSIAREYGGSGLGLSICKSLVELMGGNIYVESSYGQGSIFRFTVQMQASNISKTVFDDNYLCKNKRILLLSSNIHVVESYQSLFFGLQMSMDSYNADGLDKALIESLNANYYDLVIFDTRVQVKKDAVFYSLLHKLLLKKPDLLVLVCAAFLSEDIKNLLDMDSAVRFVTRPLTPQKIVQYFSPQTLVGSELNPDLALNDQDKIRLAKMKVILVEDNSVNRMIAVGMLKKYGITVLEMELGSVAVDWILMRNSIEDIDVILMDIEMPLMDGYTATSLIRQQEHGRNIPIIAMTANTLNTDIQKCYQYGMNGHISKPVDPQYLIRCLLNYAPLL